MPEWKDTVNLPRTGFPMKANLQTAEPEAIARWEAMDLYARIQERRKGAPSFVLHDGPPYANGQIHLGTALNKILKDLVIRSKSMAGFGVPFVPGYDCHGLPIELRVDRELGAKKREMSRADIRRACRAYARSEEHTSELQSQSNLVCRLLLEKKKKILTKTRTPITLLHENPDLSCIVAKRSHNN